MMRKGIITGAVMIVMGCTVAQSEVVMPQAPSNCVELDQMLTLSDAFQIDLSKAVALTIKGAKGSEQDGCRAIHDASTFLTTVTERLATCEGVAEFVRNDLAKQQHYQHVRAQLLVLAGLLDQSRPEMGCTAPLKP